jgi:hypothetical protein
MYMTVAYIHIEKKKSSTFIILFIHMELQGASSYEQDLMYILWKLEINIFCWKYSPLRLDIVSQRFSSTVSEICHNQGTQTQQDPASTPGYKMILPDIIPTSSSCRSCAKRISTLLVLLHSVVTRYLRSAFHKSPFHTERTPSVHKRHVTHVCMVNEFHMVETYAITTKRTCHRFFSPFVHMEQRETSRLSSVYRAFTFSTQVGSHFP